MSHEGDIAVWLEIVTLLESLLSCTRASELADIENLIYDFGNGQQS